MQQINIHLYAHTYANSINPQQCQAKKNKFFT